MLIFVTFPVKDNKKGGSMKKLLTKCPVCEGDLKVVKYQCKKCNTKISGEFEKDEMCHGLSDEIFDFIKVFISAEGSIKQAEKIADKIMVRTK